MTEIFCKNNNILISRRNYHNPNKYNALDAGIAFISFLLAFFILDKLMTPFISYLFNDRGKDYAFILCVSALISQGVIALIAFVFSRVRHVGFLSGSGYVLKFDFLNIIFALMLSFGVYFLFDTVHYEFVESWTQIIYLTDYNSLSGNLDLLLLNSNPVLLLIYAYILVPLLPAICEEALFRGVIMRGLEQFGKVFAVIASSLIFALMHGSYEQLILQFIIGLVISTAVMLTNNMLIGCVIHFCYNLGTSIFSAYAGVFSVFMPMFDYLYNALTIILGLILVTVAVIYFANMGLTKYKRKILGKPNVVPYDCYFVLKNKNTEENCSYLYGALTNELYLNAGDYLYYTGKGYRPFNRYSKTLPAAILLAVGLVLSIVMIVVSV